jgi:hypothetical protein
MAGLSVVGLTTLMKIEKQWMKMLTSIYHKGWQYAIICGGIPSSSSSVMFFLGNMMRGEQNPDALIHVTKVINDLLTAEVYVDTCFFPLTLMSLVDLRCTVVSPAHPGGRVV